MIEMFDKSIQIETLPTELIISNFVEGDKDCNYEEYLLEFFNKSSFFLQKSNCKGYHAPSSESHGECDCISDSYSLDFKLAESETLFKAKRELSFGKEVWLPGVVATTVPKKEIVCNRSLAFMPH